MKSQDTKLPIAKIPHLLSGCDSNCKPLCPTCLVLSKNLNLYLLHLVIQLLDISLRLKKKTKLYVHIKACFKTLSAVFFIVTHKGEGISVKLMKTLYSSELYIITIQPCKDWKESGPCEMVHAASRALATKPGNPSATPGAHMVEAKS